MSKFQIKWAVVVGLVLGACFLLYPTFNWYTLDPGERAQLEAERHRPNWLLNLGLDLRGGTHLLMELDVAQLPPSADINDAIQRAIEIIRNRIDQFGVAEPLIAKQGDRDIVVELPGITNSAQAKDLIGKTALLQFRMVDSSEAGQKALGKISELPAAFNGDQVTPAAAKLVPADDELLKGKDGNLFLVSKDVPLTGAQLDSARVETGGDYGAPEVGFKFKPEAASKFSNLTAANVGKNMAIVLDGQVYSAPVIKGRIPGGSGVIEGQFSVEEAKDLAIVLRAGALPAPVHVIEERTIGPTVGEDSIRKGLTAVIIGAAFIFIFMAIYYHWAGVVADLGLLLNLLLLLACMAYFGFTLTLPGLAGIVLTIAISVDDSVLVYERLREEIAEGKPIRIALDHGYDRALTAIMDSIWATTISAIFLFQFGSGPIKGFAITLLLGMLIGRFTSVTFTRLVFQSFLQNREIQTISIG